MSLSLQGIEYRVRVNTGNSAAQATKLSTSLTSLARALTVVQKQFGGAARAGAFFGNQFAGMHAVLNGLERRFTSLNALMARTASLSRLPAAGGLATGTQAAAQAIRQQTRATNALHRSQVAASGSAHSLHAALVAGLTALGAQRVFSSIRSVTLLAGRVENLETVMQNVGRTAAVSRGEMFTLEKRMKSLGITTQVAREILTRFAQNNLRVADSLKIARIAQDAAVVAGLNSSETAERMMIAVQRLDTRMLRNLGILVNLRNEYQRFALVTGRTENTLTANEKQHIVLNAVMRAGVALAGSYESALEDVFKQFTTLERKVEEAARAIGDHFLPIFQVLVTASDRVLTAVADQNKSWSTLIAILLGAGGGAAALTAVGAGFAALAALMGGPVVLGLLAVGGALGGLVAGFSAAASAQKRFLEMGRRQAEEHAHERLRLRQIADELRRLSRIRELEARQLSEIAALKQEALSMLTAEEKATLLAARSLEEYAAALLKIKRFGGPVSEADAETISRAEEKIAEVTAEITKLRKMIDETAESGGTIGLRARAIAKETIDRLEAERDILQAQIDAVKEEPRTQRLRRLNDLATQTDNVNQIAIRLRKSLDKADLTKLLPEGVDELLETINAIENLSASTSDLADVYEQARLKMQNADKKLEQRRADILSKQLSDAEKAAQIQELELKIQQEKAAILEEETAARLALEHRMETHQRLLELAAERTEQFNNESRDQAFIARMQAKGLGDVAKAAVEVNKAWQAAHTESKVLSEQLAEAEKNYAELQKRLAQGEDIQHGRDHLLRLRQTIIELREELQRVVERGSLDALSRALAEQAQELKADIATIREFRKETERLRMENDLLAQGLSRDQVQALVAAHEATEQYAEEMEKLITFHEQVTKTLDNALARGVAGDDPFVQVLRDRIRKIEAAARALADLRIEQEKKTQRELSDIQQKAADESAKATEEAFRDTVDKIERNLNDARQKITDIIKRQQEALRSTEVSIISRQLDNAQASGLNVGGFKRGLDLFREFQGMFRGAGDDPGVRGFEQIRALKGLFDQTLATEIRALLAKGDVLGARQLAAAGPGIAQRLGLDIAQRKQELRDDARQLEAAIKTADQAAQQTNLLQQMLAQGAGQLQALQALAGVKVAQGGLPAQFAAGGITGALSEGFTRWVSALARQAEAAERMADATSEKDAAALAAAKKLTEVADRQAEEQRRAKKRWDDTTRRVKQTMDALGLRN